MSFFDYSFEGAVAYHDVGSNRYRYTVVFVPSDICDQLPLKEFPRLRISGEIGEQPIEASLTPVRGKWYILLSKKLLKQIDAGMGDFVEVRFSIADQDAVDVPDDLAVALRSDEQVQKLWQKQSPGKQRGFAYRVASAKADATRQKRIDEVFRILRGELDMRGKPIKPS